MIHIREPYTLSQRFLSLDNLPLYLGDTTWLVHSLIFSLA